MDTPQAHTEQEFLQFLGQLQETNATLDFFTDFKKCYANVRPIAVKLNMLNYLIGQEDLAKAIHELWEMNPRVFSVLGILIAVRAKDKKVAFNREESSLQIEKFFETEAGVLEYLQDTGLAEFLIKEKIKNLVDYVFGIEVGLDSNARKNRSGHIMERKIADILTKAGVQFEQEVFSREFPEVYQALGVDSKQFDFVIKGKHKTYLLEVNFYNKGGRSKLNEVARAYIELAQKVNACQGYEFVWVTDGLGWMSAKNKLEEAFYAIPSIYNLTTFREFVTQLS